jgi:hypothetical protein
MRRLYGGPFDGGVATELDEPFAFIDGNGRAHVKAAKGRVAYRYAFGGWCFAGHGLQRCGCGAFLEPDPQSGEAVSACPLCGAAQPREAA